MARFKPQIKSVCIVHRFDDNPDLSHLGEYAGQFRPGAIDRQVRGDMDRNSYRYFVPAMTGEQTGNPDSPEQDYQRMEAYNRGEWHCIGIIAVATVQLSQDGPHQLLKSGGLWGVESDSDSDYLESIEHEELSELSGILSGIGCKAKEVKQAVINATHKVD
jgi:hypothetical protein